VVPTFLVAGDLRTGRLIAPFPVEIAQPRGWYLVSRDGQRDQRPVQQFRDWLRAQIAADPAI
jgi:LysR family glycine cleavage system transcriptional activator